MRISDWSSDVCASDLCSYQRDALYKIAPPRLNYRSRHQMDASPLRKLPQGLRRATSDSFATRRAMKTSLMARGRISATPLAIDRKSDVQGKRVSVRVDLGGRRLIKKKTTTSQVKK